MQKRSKDRQPESKKRRYDQITKETKENANSQESLQKKRYFEGTQNKDREQSKSKNKAPDVGEMLMQQQETCEEEVRELCRNIKQKEWCSDWIKKRYIPTRAHALDFWCEIAMQFCDQSEIDYIEKDWGQKFVQFQEDIWPKYL